MIDNHRDQESTLVNSMVVIYMRLNSGKRERLWILKN